jgi:hypothetical protein
MVKKTTSWVRKDPGAAVDNDPPASPAIDGPGFSWQRLPQQYQTKKKKKWITKFDAAQERDEKGRWSYEGPSVKSLFSDNLGYKRSEMPQIPDGKLKSEFLSGLKHQGVLVENETVQARTLKPTQKEFNEQNIEGLRAAFDRGEYKGGNRILVSKDHRVLDGHHRWAMLAQKNQPVEVVRIGLSMKDLMPLALKFDSAHKVEHRSAQQHDAIKKSDPGYWEQFESLEVIKDDASDGSEATEVNSAAGRPRWMQSPGQGGVDPVYRSQKPDGNKDTTFSKNVNQNPPTLIPVDPDSYYIW